MKSRPWLPPQCNEFVQSVTGRISGLDQGAVDAEILNLVEASRRIYECECVNLNPAANIMNPRAEALLSCGLGSRPSLGFPGNKYETGVEALEQIEVIAAQLATEVFGSQYAEVRVPSGAVANLYVFMATSAPGDLIIAPPPDIGGHVTHHRAGAAGLHGVETHAAPVDPVNYTVDLEALRRQALELRPKLITIGGSLNLFPHPIPKIRAIADEVGAWLLFDAAHMAGMIAGGAWESPLQQGAHIMTMSTYKSLGGPPSGLIVTNNDDLAERITSIAFPGLTANFDMGKTAALALGLLDWKAHGSAYANAMAATARALAQSLAAEGVPVFGAVRGYTQSHQLAIEAHRYGGGQFAARRMRKANILATGIGLPIEPLAQDFNGIRLGTNEIVRRGATVTDMPELAKLIADSLEARRREREIAKDVTHFRARLEGIHFVR